MLIIGKIDEEGRRRGICELCTISSIDLQPKLFQKIKPINLIKKHTQRENIAASKSINIFNQLFTSTFHYLCTYMNMLCSRHHNNSETKSSSEQESLPLGFASLRYRKSLPLISPL